MPAGEMSLGAVMAEGLGNTIALPAIVDLDALDNVRDMLLDAVESGSSVANGAAVERISTNALLMLVSAAETARRNSFSFTVEGASEPMRAAIERLGFGEHFAAMIKG
jgi:anti-anti-sigma regulatory factor